MGLLSRVSFSVWAATHLLPAFAIAAHLMAAGDRVPYARQLLMDIGRGETSVSKALWHAAASIEEHGAGPQSDPMLLELATLGEVSKRHRERGLHRWASKQAWRTLLPAVYSFKCTKYRGARQGLRAATHHCLLPHEVVGTLADVECQELRDHILGSPSSWAKFWRGLARGSDALVATSDVLGAATDTVGSGVSSGMRVATPMPSAASPNVFIPVGMHGDDAGVSAGEKVLVLTWGALTSAGGAPDTRIVFTMCQATEASKGATVVPKIYKVLAWSFSALASGCWPTTDHEGAVFPPDSARGRRAGSPLLVHNGKLVGGKFAEMRGDWKYLKETMHLHEHYGKTQVCHRCKASKAPGPRHYGHFGRTHPLRGTAVSHAAWSRAQLQSTSPCPLIGVPGFTMELCYFDLMHTLDLGVLQVAVPSALHEVTRDSRIFPGRNLEERLLSATQRYHEWCAEHRIAEKAKAITRKWVDLPHPRVTQQQVKAAAMRSMAYWVRDVLAPTRRTSRGAQCRWAFFHYVCSADEVMRQAGRHLRSAEREALARKTEAALHIYLQLHARARARGLSLWRLLPKHHAWSHIAYDNCGTNPRVVHCYLDEDMVGRMKRLYTKCHASTAPSRALLRYILQQCMHWLALYEKVHPRLLKRPASDLAAAPPAQRRRAN